MRKKYQIIKTFTFDAGHRMYNHDLLSDRGAELLKDKASTLGWKRYQCSHPHGHTFRVEIVIESDFLDNQNVVLDTDKIKRVIKDFMDIYDHAYIIGKDDPLREDFIKLFQGYRVVVIDAVPTAEAIAEEIYNFFDNRFKVLATDEYKKTFKLSEIRLRMASTIEAIYKKEEES